MVVPARSRRISQKMSGCGCCEETNVAVHSLVGHINSKKAVPCCQLDQVRCLFLSSFGSFLPASGFWSFVRGARVAMPRVVSIVRAGVPDRREPRAVTPRGAMSPCGWMRSEGRRSCRVRWPPRGLPRRQSIHRRFLWIRRRMTPPGGRSVLRPTRLAPLWSLRLLAQKRRLSRTKSAGQNLRRRIA